MEHHLATVWESIADATPGQPAIVQGLTKRSWSELDDRAARVAKAMLDAGLGAGSKVAQYLYNSPEYCESYFAALKIRAVPVNINYRYLDDELLYLLGDSDAEALVFHASLGDRVGRILARAPRLRLLVEVDDASGHVEGADRYEDLVAGRAPAARIPRNGDDVVMIYTGGTTGMPKGVVSPIRLAVDAFLASVPPTAGLAPLDDPAGAAPAALRLATEGRQIAALPACPLMHGTGLGSAISTMTLGGRIVLLAGRGLDAGELWSAAEREAVASIAIVGDAFARPMLRELRQGTRRNLGCVRRINSAGAMFSAQVKRGLLDLLPEVTIFDHVAATEGAIGMSISTKDEVAPTGRFVPHPGVTVIAEDGREVEPGSGAAGMITVSGTLPGGYFRDEVKTAETFRVIGGTRRSLPGDWATVELDGTITLLGRGSHCINTGGEKVFPEEVEEVVKLHRAIDDCLVFSVADERFGERVVAVASLEPGSYATPADVIAAATGRLASYKLPRELVLVDVVPRAPNGKADYRRARDLFYAH